MKQLKGTPVERYCSRLQDMTDTRYSRQAPIPKSNPTKTSESLEQLVDSYPLLADLHVHLLGTGDVKFWRDQLSLSPQTVIPSDIQARLRLKSVCQVKNRNLVFDDLIKIGDLLSEVFELNEPIPGRFDEDFSPLFSLRQFIAQNNPEVLTRLIQWNAERYVNSGVHYAELSLGVGWFNEPYLTHIIRGIISAEIDHSVLFRLLIAFNRTQISPDIHKPEYLRPLAKLKDRKLAPTEDTSYYIEHLKQLELVKKSLENNTNSKKFVVGLDIVGNEENRPYTPFLLPEFLDFARDMRKENPNFGFRLHLGEGISADNDIGYVSLRLGEHYISVLSKKHRFRVRSGHGIGLLSLDSVAYNRWKNYPRMRDAASKRLLENLQIATVEINLTSNYYLLNDPGCFPSNDRSLGSHVLSPLMQKGFNIVLGTDDPGIFPDVSMRSEFRKAVKNCLIRDTNTFIAMVEESVRANFADQDTIDKLSNIVSERYPHVVVPRDKRPIPEFQPLVEITQDRQQSAREYQDIKKAKYERALIQHKNGSNFQAIEEWYAEYDPP